MLVGLVCWQCSAGDIVGSVKAQGKDPSQGKRGSAKYQSRAFKFLETIDYSQLRDFVVYLESSVPNSGVEKGHWEEIVQKGGRFLPKLLPIAVGTWVRWPNQDDIFHNVFSYSDPMPFDLGLYKGDRGEDGELKQIQFKKTGRVDVFCSIHKKMHCIILVVPNRFYAKTDRRGRFKIPGVPAGEYQITAWHEQMPPQTRTVAVGSDGTVKVDFTLGLQNLPKY